MLTVAMPTVAMIMVAQDRDRHGRDTRGKKRLRAIGIRPPAWLGMRGLLGMTADLPP